MPGAFQLRTEVRPGDLGRIIELHGVLYAREKNWNQVFEAYVAEGLAAFALNYNTTTDKLWIAESPQGLAGSIAIVADRQRSRTAQLRWFLVHPEARNQGLGRLLLETALAFCRQSSVDRVFLWTVTGLEASSRLYRAAGFRVTEEHSHDNWGPSVVEQRMELRLA